MKLRHNNIIFLFLILSFVIFTNTSAYAEGPADILEQTLILDDGKPLDVTAAPELGDSQAKKEKAASGEVIGEIKEKIAQETLKDGVGEDVGVAKTISNKISSLIDKIKGSDANNIPTDDIPNSNSDLPEDSVLSGLDDDINTVNEELEKELDIDFEYEENTSKKDSSILESIADMFDFSDEENKDIPEVVTPAKEIIYNDTPVEIGVIGESNIKDVNIAIPSPATQEVSEDIEETDAPIIDVDIEKKLEKDNKGFSSPDIGGFDDLDDEDLDFANNPFLTDDFNSEKAKKKRKKAKRKKLAKAKGLYASPSTFDIVGVMLRMNIIDAEHNLQRNGYKKVIEKREIPNFIKWRNEEKCRNKGVVGYERLNTCVVDVSKSTGDEYIKEAKYIKHDTKEEVIIYLTSNFTNNKIYKIVYTSTSATITGNSSKAMYLRNLKIHSFWKRISRKYGPPDDEEEIMWGDDEDSEPYMKANNGFLLLEDKMLEELDYAKMSREDQKYMKTDIYSF